MTLGALASAGAPLAEVSQSLKNLDVPFEIHVESVEISGVHALRLVVEHPEEHSHRTFADIRRLVESASLPERAARRAVEAFQLLANAEGTVHDRAPEDVTFHEVGAVDSIVDVVGSCVALELLGVESVSCSPLPMGTASWRPRMVPCPSPARRPSKSSRARGCAGLKSPKRQRPRPERLSWRA